MLDETGALGDITVNFGTGTAQEAANWVAYMTAPAKNNYWGGLRAKNGHSAPYQIPYWEVGNEQQSLELYWRSGSLVSIGNGQEKCASSNVHLCEYVFGGTTKFEDQKALNSANLASSSGKPGQVYYAKYPPVIQSSLSLYVNGKLWAQTANINEASSRALVYQLDSTTGMISFGNGIHGAILPKGAVVTLSYESGPHDGFIKYYQLMKAADPSAHICSSYGSTSFMQLMGDTYPYNCIVTHLYGESIPSITDTTLFHNELMQQSFNFSTTLSTERADLVKYAGAAAKNIQIALTEYGVNALTSPANQPNYHLSQDIALFDANTLRIIIDNHIPVAEKHYLISYINSSPPGLQFFVNSGTFANNAIISGPGPNIVTQPSGYVLEAFSKLLYAHQISSAINNNPAVSYQSGSYPALSTLATTDGKGHESIMVINLSPSSNISAEVSPSLSNYSVATSWTLGSNSLLAYNTLSDPYTVGFIKASAHLSKGKLFATFPAGSITVLQFK